ncbi:MULTISPECIES: NADH-quinone oxidoreductase subunit NuoE family protein [Vallitalea]|uniref:NAD(P)H-dependent oxidoreductase subunit E n=2 Tax=Vallitalea TaxID=1348611 RepID=A0A8J8M6X4_9FIRM|nr:NAD(P)H-dependent oxidoreductase subunit E [Vallitalea guaymasensis]QUH27512.1 NAD(P)H-dependent oxidoreductase subunit E [Vallitalea guaymasensis]GMQ62725.1 NADH-quinone oxidoreductase subunit NuoE [Vallitalea sp. AN17-2]
MDKLKKCQCEDMSEEEKIAMIGEFIEEYKNKEGSLIQVLHIAQTIYGHLPINIQKIIADGLDKPLSEVSGVVSFYSFFSTVPRGKYTIRVCLGTACYVRGGKKILDKLQEILGIGIGETTEDKKFTLEVMRCIGACGLAPAISINDTVYKQVNPDKLSEILEKY